MKSPFQAELDSRLCCRFAKPNFIHHFAVLVLHLVVLTPIVAFAAGPPLQFAKMVGGLYGSAVASDFQGNIYVGTGPYGAVLVKYDPNGNVIWSFGKENDSSGLLQVLSIVVDDSGNVYTGGTLWGTVKAGLITSQGGDSSVFFAKFAPDGSNILAKVFRNMYSSGKPLAKTPDGGFLVGGRFNNPVSYEGITVSPTDYSDALLFKINENGSPEWYRRGTGNSDDFLDGVASASDGGVFVSGTSMSRSFGMAGEVISIAASKGLYLVKMDSAGTGVWSKSVGSGLDSGNFITVASAVTVSQNTHDIIWAGDFTDSLTLSPQTVTSTGGKDAFVAKISSNGTVQWVRKIGGADDQFASAATMDASGNIYVAGFFAGTLTIDSMTLNSLGSQDIYILKFRNNGAPIWAKRIGSPGMDNEVSLAFSRNGELLVTGTVRGGASIDGTFLEGINSSDGFLAKFHSESIPPRFIIEPQSQVVSAGMTFTLAADLAVSDPSVRFQWWFNGTALSGQTNRVLSVINAQSANAGSYYLVATNDGGHATSGSALISYTDASTLVLSVHPSLTIFGTPGRTYQIEYASDTRVPAQWTSVTNLTITSSPEVWIDPTAAVGEKRFYRVLLRP